MTIMVGLGILAVALMSGQPQSVQPIPQSAEELVAELRQFPAALGPSVRSDGTLDAMEERRGSIYHRLWTLGAAARPALTRGLLDSDVQTRRNVALFLNVAGGIWYEPTRRR